MTLPLRRLLRLPLQPAPRPHVLTATILAIRTAATTSARTIHAAAAVTRTLVLPSVSLSAPAVSAQWTTAAAPPQPLHSRTREDRIRTNSDASSADAVRRTVLLLLAAGGVTVAAAVGGAAAQCAGADRRESAAVGTGGLPSTVTMRSNKAGAPELTLILQRTSVWRVAGSSSSSSVAGAADLTVGVYGQQGESSLPAAPSAPLAVCLLVPSSGARGAAIGAQMERLIDAHLPAESLARCGDITSCANLADAIRSAFIAQPPSVPPTAATAAGVVRLLSGPLVPPSTTSEAGLLPSGTCITIEMPTADTVSVFLNGALLTCVQSRMLRRAVADAFRSADRQ